MFGRWKVLYQVDDYVNAGGRYSQWRCECQCENHTIKNVIGANLTSGKTLSCGCIAKEERQSRIIDLTGKKYGRLTVINRVDDYISPKGQIKPRWKCQCECGNYSIVDSRQLRNGKVVSCGCYGREQTIKALKKYNTYELCGNYYIGYDDNNQKFYFDKDDYDKVKNYYWRVEPSTNYVSCSTANIRLHELIMDSKGTGLLVDHIHGAKTRNDNRKCNLRLSTTQQNNYNKDYGEAGVTYNSKQKKWISQIKVNKKQIIIGKYDTKEQAIKARKEAENEYYGDFSYEKSQQIPYERIE